MKKRGVELSMNVIIIAAIALIVLVILVLLVTNAGNRVVGGVACGSNLEGKCTELFDSTCADERGEGYTSSGRQSCEQGQVCCVRPLG